MKTKAYARIVVEGMDGSGKTTLVEQLQDYLGDRGYIISGYNRIEGDKPPIQQWWMEQLAFNPVGQVVVHDRFYYPELVYGPVLRNKIAVDLSTKLYVENFLRNNALLIYCRPPTGVLSQSIHEEDQMEGVIERFTDLLVAYDRLMIKEAPLYNGRFIKYDWNNLMGLLNKVAGYIY